MDSGLNPFGEEALRSRGTPGVQRVLVAGLRGLSSPDSATSLTYLTGVSPALLRRFPFSERALAAQYCAQFAAKKIANTITEDEASEKACADAAGWIKAEAKVLGANSRLRQLLRRPIAHTTVSSDTQARSRGAKAALR
eukprot:scaffold789_cov261-Pinguiococcus_pyrenoidosus.AAC.12